MGRVRRFVLLYVKLCGCSYQLYRRQSYEDGIRGKNRLTVYLSVTTYILSLQTRMVHISPSELLLPEEGLSKSTEKILAYFTTYVLQGFLETDGGPKFRFTGKRHSWTDHKIRIERYGKKWTYTNAFSYLSEFYTDKNKGAAGSESFKSGLCTPHVHTIFFS